MTDIFRHYGEIEKIRL
ncbi:MAG: hypothetical protein ACKO96_10115 [Flammeovirgaceae bacterium]